MAQSLADNSVTRKFRAYRGKYRRVQDRFIDSGLTFDQLPAKLHEGPPYDVAIVDYLIDMVREGITLSSMLRDDPTLPTYSEFLTFLKSQPDRWEEYKEAQSIAAEIFADKSRIEAEGTENANDVARSKLIVDHYKFLMAVYNRDRYGDKKQIDINQKIDLTAAMRDAEKRLAGTTIEGHAERVDDTLRLLGIDE